MTIQAQRWGREGSYVGAKFLYIIEIQLALL